LFIYCLLIYRHIYTRDTTNLQSIEKDSTLKNKGKDKERLGIKSDDFVDDDSDLNEIEHKN
jgi:hypothetical protein